jgi:predicted MFS family arabinose efflux permease
MIRATHPKLALWGLSLFAFSVLLDETIVSTALPSIQQALRTNSQTLQLILNCFFIAIASLSILLTKLAERVGFLKLLYPAMIAFLLGCLGAGLSQQIGSLLFFRICLAIAAAATLTLPVAIIVISVPAEEQQRAIGFYGFIRTSGMVIGPFAGGLLLSKFNWPSVFFFTIPFGLLALIGCHFSQLKQSNDRSTTPIPWRSGLSLCVTIGSLVSLLSFWQSLTMITNIILITLFTLSAIEFIRLQKKSQSIIDFSLLKSPRFTATLLAAFIMGSFMSCILLFIPLYSAHVIHITTQQLSHYLLVLTITVMISSLLFGFIKTQFQPFHSLCFVVALLIVIATLIFSLPPEQSIIHLGGICFLMGISWGIMNIALTLSTIQSVGPKHKATGIGMLYTVFNLGSAISLAFTAMLSTWQQHRYLINALSEQGIKLTLTQSNQLNKVIGHSHPLQTWFNQLQSLNPTLAHNTINLSWLSGQHAAGVFLCCLASLGFIALLTVNLKKKEVSDGN